MKGGNSDWTDEDIESILTTLFLLIFVTIFISYIILKLQGGSNTSSNNRNTNQTNRASNVERQRLSHQQQANALNNNDDDDYWYKKCLNPLAQRLVDGVLPFRFISASRYSSKGTGAVSSDATLAMLATIFLQKQNDSNIIPSRGSNIVLSLDESVISPSSKEKLCNMLTILGTTYNLFVILSITSSINNDIKQINDKVSSYRTKLYEMGVPSDVISPHRIIACSSVVGRVAFVRQLKPDAVIDFDVEMSDQLSRFGFRVVIVGNDFYDS